MARSYGCKPNCFDNKAYPIVNCIRGFLSRFIHTVHPRVFIVRREVDKLTLGSLSTADHQSYVVNHMKSVDESLEEVQTAIGQGDADKYEGALRSRLPRRLELVRACLWSFGVVMITAHHTRKAKRHGTSHRPCL